MKMENFKKLLAFTLAEVLITLSILGVVAAITVPSLINHQHKNEVETKIISFVSTMEHVLEVSQVENGNFSTWEGTNSNDIMEKYVIPYMKITKKNTTSDPNPALEYTITRPNSSMASGSIGKPGYCLANGICFSFICSSASNKLTYNNNASDNLGYGRICEIPFDINGPKKPNQNGRDGFTIDWYVNPKTGSTYISAYQYPNTMPNSTKSTKLSQCKSGYNAAHCMYLIKDNHWKIPSDYPWL